MTISGFRALALVFLVALVATLAGCHSSGTQNNGNATSGAPPEETSTPRPPNLGARLKVSFIDVGQGDSELIQTPSGRNILIDAGPASARDTVLDYLAQCGVSRLTMAVASHPHEDHIGGMPTILRQLPVGDFLDSGLVTASPRQRKMLEAIKARGIKFENVSRGLCGTSRDLGDGIVLQILQPQAPLLEGTSSDPNNNSIVLKIIDGAVSFLFAGDQEDAERERLYSSGADLRATIYKVAHHGSSNGTDDEFARRIRPREAIISCGVGNDYGHPHAEALKALELQKARVWRTDLQGTIQVTTDGATYDVQALGKGLAATPAPRHDAVAPPAADGASQIIGNRRSHIYHLPGSSGKLPAQSNRIYFHSAAEAEAAGYRASRGG